MRRSSFAFLTALAILMGTSAQARQESAAAQQQNKQPESTSRPPIFDAPSATRPLPSPPFPADTRPEPAIKPEASSPSAASDSPDAQQPQAAPLSQITTVPQREKAQEGDDSGREQFVFSISANFVTVPVTVKDADGRLIDGLLRKDFAIYEDGEPQNLRLFTSDPFPLSAAVVLDQNIPETTMKKINESFTSIAGAFSPFDEVALYIYGNHVSNVADFGAVDSQFTAALRRSRQRGKTGGVPIVSGPLAAGPTVSGVPLDPGAPRVHTPTRETHALNDAILRAAQDLSKRDRARRKIIIVISDGQERGSRASYADVMKVLLSNEIGVYALGVDAAAIPGYSRLNRISFPGLGEGDILPKYVSATGGEYFTEFTRAAIERAYARLTEVARNQYTLGYTAKATTAGNYRAIEVRVKRPGLKVYAKDGYYPLPPPKR